MMMVEMLARMPDLRRRIQAVHVSDATGHCRDCVCAIWPCELYLMASAADRRVGTAPSAAAPPRQPVRHPQQRGPAQPPRQGGARPPAQPAFPPPPRGPHRSLRPGTASQPGGPGPATQPRGRAVRVPSQVPAPLPAELSGALPVYRPGPVPVQQPSELSGPMPAQFAPRRQPAYPAEPSSQDRAAPALSWLPSHPTGSRRPETPPPGPAAGTSPRHLFGAPVAPPPAQRQEFIDVLEDVLRWSS